MTPNLPSRVVVGANGAYWRDYTDSDHPGYSMCPVSEDNEPVEAVAVYVRATPTPDTRLREALLSIIREAEEVTEAQHGTPHGALYAIIRRAREALDATREETT